MPYIKANDGRREALQKGDIALNAGELNYQMFYYVKHNLAVKNNVLYEQIKTYVDNFLGYNPNYQRYNDMTGCLVRCSKEIVRRLSIAIPAQILLNVMENYDEKIADYEDDKIAQNGDVK